MQSLKRILAALAVVILVAAVATYVWGGLIANQSYAAETRKIQLSADPDVIARGERLAKVFGCYNGCHGAEMEGQVLIDDWYAGRVIAPGLAHAVEQYTPAELEAIIRQGVRPDGTSVLAMPAASYAVMTDQDLSAILSFIAGYERQDLDLGHSTHGMMGRLLLVTGNLEPAAKLVRDAPWPADQLRNPEKLGEYLARNACTECHGMDLGGREDFTPSLEGVKGYSMADFRKLMATGEGRSGNQVGMMSMVIRHRFGNLTDDEAVALHAYLQTL